MPARSIRKALAEGSRQVVNYAYASYKLVTNLRDDTLLVCLYELVPR